MNTNEMIYKFLKYSHLFPHLLFVIMVVVGTYCTLLTGIDNYSNNLSLLEALYHTIKLFVLGAEGPPGNDPQWARNTLYVIYFLAPTLTIGVFIKSLNNLIYNPNRQAKKAKEHVIIGGTGKLGIEVYDRLINKGIPVIPIDNREDNSFISRIRSERKPYIIGNMTLSDTLQRANVQQANLFIGLSGDDIANLESAISIKDMPNNSCECFIQIKDPHFYESIKPHLKKRKIKVFNSYEIVAKRVADILYENINKTSVKKNQSNKEINDCIVIAGFGTFGKMVAKVLLSQNKTRLHFQRESIKIVVIDYKTTAEDDWKAFCSLHNITNGQEVIIVPGNIKNPDTWNNVKSKGNPLSVIMATDNDSSNVSTSFLLTDEKYLGGDMLVVTRLFKKVASLQKNIPKIKPLVFSEITMQEIMRHIKRMAK